MAEEDDPTPVHKHEPDDMDIDLAVAEILEEDDKSKVAPMELDGADDVEDELLSLVDDRLPPPSAVPTSRSKLATPTIPAAPFKPPSTLRANVDEVKHPSSLVSISVSPTPAVLPPSAHHGSDRGSMPPPSAAPRGKDKEDEVPKKGESVSATAAQAAKKKKDSGNKVSVQCYNE